MVSMKLTALAALLSASIAALPTRAIAFDFQMGSNETIVLDDDFDTGTGWRVDSSLQISGGLLTSQNTGAYGRASYTLENPLNLSEGAINLYWVGAFPNNARKEREAYWPSLQYVDNPAVCWNSSTNEVLALGSDGGCDSSYLRVDEDGELRTWLRPDGPTSFNRLYVDQGFIPGLDPERLSNPLAQLSIPDHPDASAEQYRLRLEQLNGVSEAVLSYWNGTDWQSLNARNGSSVPLLIDDSDWIDINGVIQEPIFEALNFQFRGPGPDGIATSVDAVRLTQERSASAPQDVPEPLSVLGLLVVAGLGYRLNRTQQT